MACVRDGQLEAMDALYDRHHHHLFHFFLGMTGRRGPSEDLVQEVFLRMFKYRASFKAGAPFRPWMFRIARHLHADYLRGLRAEDPLGALEEVLPDGGDGIHQRLEEESDRRLLALALARLEPEKRELLLLSRDPGLTGKDLAVLFACSEGAVKVKVHRALQDLRSAFQKIPGAAHAMR